MSLFDNSLMSKTIARDPGRCRAVPAALGGARCCGHPSHGNLGYLVQFVLVVMSWDLAFSLVFCAVGTLGFAAVFVSFGLFLPVVMFFSWAWPSFSCLA